MTEGNVDTSPRRRRGCNSSQANGDKLLELRGGALVVAAQEAQGLSTLENRRFADYRAGSVSQGGLVGR